MKEREEGRDRSGGKGVCMHPDECVLEGWLLPLRYAMQRALCMCVYMYMTYSLSFARFSKVVRG